MKRSAILFELCAAIVFSITILSNRSGGSGIQGQGHGDVSPAAVVMAETHAVENNDEESMTLPSEQSSNAVIIAFKSRVERAKAAVVNNNKVIRERYKAIFGELGVTDTVIDAVVADINARQVIIDTILSPLVAKYSVNVVVDVSDDETVRTFGTYGDSDAWNNAKIQISEPVEDEIMMTLGDKYAAFHNYDRLLGYKVLVDELNQMLDGNNQITYQQSQLLVAALDGAHPAGMPENATGFLTQSVLDAGRNILNEAQFSALSALADKNFKLQQAIDAKLSALLKGGWRGNKTSEPIIIHDPFF